MKNIFKVLAIGGILGAPGCASQCSVTDVACNLNADAGALSSPAANQAVANIKAGAKAIVCAVPSVAQIADQIAQQTKAGQVAIKDAQTVYAVSSTVCAALGGTSTGTATVPASAIAPAG